MSNAVRLATLSALHLGTWASCEGVGAMLAGGEHLLSKLLFLEEECTQERRGEGTSTGGHECQAEVCGGEPLEWELGHPHSCVRAAAQWEGRDELPQPSCPLSQVLPGPSGLGWAGNPPTQSQVRLRWSSPKLWDTVGTNPKEWKGDGGCAGRRRGRRKSWLRSNSDQRRGG